MSRDQLHIYALDRDVGGNIYFKVGDILNKDENIIYHGKLLTKRDLFIIAIQLNWENAEAYNNLANTLELDETVDFGKVGNGLKYSKQHLYLLAIDLDPDQFEYYINLGNTLPPGGKIPIKEGKEVVKEQLYLQAIHLNPSIAWVYSYLASAPPTTANAFKLMNDVVMTRKQLCVKSIEIDSERQEPYSILVKLMSNDEIILLKGRPFKKIHLYLESIRLDPKNVSAYWGLIQLLNNDEKIQLPDEQKLSRLDLCLKLIGIDSNYPEPYSVLGDLIAYNQKIKLPNGQRMTKTDLYLKAIHLDPELKSSIASNTYTGLISLLEPSGKY